MKIYFYLVTLSLVSDLVRFFYRDVMWDSYNNNMQVLLAADGIGSTLSNVSYLFFGLNILCYIGLYFFQFWAILLMLLLDIGFYLLLFPFIGVEVSLPIEQLMRNILLFVDGLIFMFVINNWGKNSWEMLTMRVGAIFKKGILAMFKFKK